MNATPPPGDLHAVIERLGALVALSIALAPALSQSAIDRHVGRSRGYTAKLLAGEYEDVGSLVLQRYARFFGVPAGWLAYGEGPSPLPAATDPPEVVARAHAALLRAIQGARRGHPARPSTRGAHELREVA